MPEPTIQIIRDQLPLGSLPEPEALELLRAGFLRADDWFIRDGTTERIPISALETPASRPSQDTAGKRGSWLGRAKDSVTNTAGSLAGSVGSIAGRLKDLATETPAAVTQRTNRLLEGYLPQIRRLVQNVSASRPVAALNAGVRDDELMRKTFGAVYDLLPRPVCRFINEERFIGFCLEHRARLLGNDEAKAPQQLESGDVSAPTPDGSQS